MKQQTPSIDEQGTGGLRGNLSPALVVTLALPALAILASLATVFIAVRQGNPELPEQFHWEGLRLDRDFARFQRAVELDVRASFEASSEWGVCRLRLSLADTPPDAVRLRFVHATLAGRDRQVTLMREGAEYRGSCEPLPAGSWWVELGDVAETWSIRQHVTGSMERLTLGAKATEAGEAV